MSKPKKKFDTSGESHENVRELGQRKKMSVHDLSSFRAKKPNQEEFLRLFYQQTPLISLHGYAGTGKTFIALAAALSEVLDPSTPYQKVTIIRSVVELRPMGFLPGTVEEKISEYEQPYKEIFKELMKYKNPYDHAKALGYVEFLPTSFLRGVTFNDQIVIVDESENMDYAELSTVVTRIGQNAKVVFIGDDAQTDLTRRREKSGFHAFRKVLQNMPSNLTGFIEFGINDIVRSELVKQYIIAEAKTEQ